MFQTTQQDVILSGHGSTFPDKHKVTKVPDGVEFCMFGPPGTSITDNLGQMLEGGVYIRRIYLTSPKSGEEIELKPSVYTAKSGDIPNLMLHAPRGIAVGGQGVVPHVIGVEKATHLHDLWPRLKPFLRKGEVLRVIWAACSTLGTEDP